MNKQLTDDFRQYMSTRYGAKGRRSIRFSTRLDELDILLGVKDVTDFDEEDKKFLNNEQLEELEKLRIKTEDTRKCTEMERNLMEYIRY